MLQGVTDIAGMCVGLLGLIGAAATTGMPMWKVTAFIGENIIVMETRWEGLWMNCFRQANIRMQCKVYDSLLYLPAELQAARGLMCCSIALSGLGLLVASAGMKCISCIQGNERAKTIILMVAGGMQLLASISVFIPVSWTGHVIIRDFYNPLLIDAQRRELGEALYIGWVTGAVLFASAMLFLCRKLPSEKGSFDLYTQAKLLQYKQQPNQLPMMRYHPLSTISSLSGPPNSMSFGNQQAIPNHGPPFNAPMVYDPSLPESASLQYQANLAHQASMRSSNHPHSMYTPGNSAYVSHSTMPFTQTDNPSTTYQSSYYPVPQTPVFIGYNRSMMHHPSATSSGMYI
ncbi:claudin-8-like [Eucyclogobius newberryi]|uniref:claudin-8-like n=1 Tax=Eucyclogobius newberryi TaxID=166745 RepID=UPI003B5CDC17